MKKLITILICTLSLQSFGQWDSTKDNNIPCLSNGTMSGHEEGIIFTPHNMNKSGVRKYATIIMNNGAGESGSKDSIWVWYKNTRAGGPLYFVYSGKLQIAYSNPSTGSFDSMVIVGCRYPANIDPVTHQGGWGNNGADVDSIKSYLVKTYPFIDPNRITVTGISAGGIGTVDDATHLGTDANGHQRYKSVAIGPSSPAIGTPTQAMADSIIKFGIHVWAQGDTGTWVGTKQVSSDGYGIAANQLVKLVKSSGGDAWFTQMNYAGHNYWDSFYYDPSWKQTIKVNGTNQSINFYQFALAYTRSNTVAASVYAGADQTVNYPNTSTTLSGAANAATGKTITSTQWTKVSGPNTPTIVSPSSLSTNVTGLIAGTYVFKLTATQSDNSTLSDQVNVTVMGSCSGVKRIFTAAGDGGILKHGSSTTYAPGDTIVISHNSGNFYSYIYLEGFNGTPTCPVTIINDIGGTFVTGHLNLDNCTYINLVGTGDKNITNGFTFSDPAEFPANVSCNSANQNLNEAINISGKSKNIEISHLYITKKKYGFIIKNDGDCDSTINNWVLDSIKVHDTKIRNLESQGFYMGNTDPEGLYRVDTCNGVATYPWPSRLGDIEVYNMDIDSTGRPGIQLSGAFYGHSSIHDNTVKHTGRQHDDQQGSGIALGSMTKCDVYNNYVQTTYTWSISALGAYYANIYNNTCDSAGYADQNLVTQPDSSCGGGSGWTTGPSNIIFDTRQENLSNHSLDSVNFIIRNNSLNHNYQSHAVEVNNSAGTYPYTSYFNNYICSNSYNNQAAVVSVSSGIHYSTDCSAIADNLPPLVDAGNDQSITLPNNSVTLSGTASDPDGTISSVLWYLNDGPSTFTIASPNSLTTNVTDLVQGTYHFTLSATDNQGAVSYSVVQVTVNPVPNQPPTANAGGNKSITLPTNSVTLNGSGSDPDGTIASYQWKENSGPNSATIVSPTSASTVVNNLIAGTYVFQLTVTDNQGATQSSTMQLIVNATAPPPDQPNAVKIRTIRSKSVIIH